jgi:hypothetical protein
MFYATLMQDGFIHVEDTIPEGTVIDFRLTPEEALILKNALDTELDKNKRLKKNMQFVSKFVKNWASVGYLFLLMLLLINFGIKRMFPELDFTAIILGLAIIYTGVGEIFEQYIKQKFKKVGIL